jgi:pentatricopeptide repeat protein
MFQKSVRSCPKSFLKYYTRRLELEKKKEIPVRIETGKLTLQFFSHKEILEIKSTMNKMSEFFEKEPEKIDKSIEYLKSLLKFEKEHPIIYSFTFYELFKMEKFKMIEKLLELMENNHVDSSLVINTIQYFPFPQTFHFIEHFSKIPNIFVFEFVLKSKIRYKMSDAIEYFEKQSKIIKPNHSIFYLLISGIISNKFYGITKAVSYFNLMKNEFDLKPSYEHISIILLAFTKEGNIKNAEIYFEFMETSGFVPNLDIFNSFIRIYLKNHDLDSAFKYLNLAHSKGINLDPTIFELFISYFTSENDLKKAVDFIESVPETYNTNIGMEFFRPIVPKAFKIGDLQIVEYILSIDSVLNIKMDIWTLNMVLNGYCNMNDIKNVEKVVSLIILKYKFEPTNFTFHILIEMYCRLKMPEKASEIVDIVIDKGMQLNMSAFRQISECFKTLGNHKRSSEFALVVAAEKSRYKQNLQNQYGSVSRNTSHFSNEFKSVLLDSKKK